MDITQILNSLEAETKTEKQQQTDDMDEFKERIKGKNKTLEVLHFNVSSATKHFEEILIFLESCDLQDTDIVILGETRNNFNLNQFNIPGFTTHFNNSQLNQNDGLLLFINNNIDCNIDHTTPYYRFHRLQFQK